MIVHDELGRKRFSPALRYDLPFAWWDEGHS
jgi:hypothetical protein